MKVACLLFVALSLSAATFIPTKAPETPVDDAWSERQLKVISLLEWNQVEDPYRNEYSDWDITMQGEHFTKPSVFEKFVESYLEGDFIPRGSTFNNYDRKTLRQTFYLYSIFYYAKDFDTFYKAASWARKHVNFMNFQLAFTVALYTRSDTAGLEVTPFYETVPNYFVTADLLRQAYIAKMTGHEQWTGYLNYTGFYRANTRGQSGSISKYREEEEYQISYFREDVALNEFYSKWQMYWPAWVDTQEMGLAEFHKRGEIFYYLHQQILARYNLERAANGLPPVQLLLRDHPIKSGYNPNMVDLEGNYLAVRPDNFVLKEFDFYNDYDLTDIEIKLYDSIDARLFYDPNVTLINFKDYEATDLIGRALFGAPNTVSKGYYKSYFFRYLQSLAFAVKTNFENQIVPGVAGTMLTALRDPAYYNFLQNFNKYFVQYKKTLPAYTVNELNYPGVKIDSLDVDKLTTFFDSFEFDITNSLAFKSDEERSKLDFRARQFRLNRKPFSYRVSITSDRSEDAMIRIFFGPKYDYQGRELNYNTGRGAFFEFDRIPVKLTEGQNIFERSNKETTVFTSDYVPTKTFKEYVSTKKKSFFRQSYHCGFPENLQLPKGKKSGLPLVFFAIVTPFTNKYGVEPQEKYFENFVLCGGSKFDDGRPYGFPFDRPIPFEQGFNVPNVYAKDVLVFHKEDHDFFKTY